MKDTERRADPDALARAIEREDEATRRGHLKIFFGYAAGVGKTYAMLKAAHAAKSRGIDVVIGYLEPHARPRTAAMARGLETVPTRDIRRERITYHEFDIDATLERAPQLVLVDELAHTCAPGSRHQKRYQDVEELLRAGIDVYTTINVQHIESLNDMVASVTGVIVHERIPDHVFDNADQVELVDIEPEDLIERLRAGQIYVPNQAERALDNFFTVENLTALREIALRRCADRMNLLSDEARAKNNRDYHTGEHVLVAVSSSRSNPTIIRTASRMAQAFRGAFTALYVETPDNQDISEADAKQLRANQALAEQLGAHVVNVYGDDVAFQLAEYARLSGVSKIVLGRNTAMRTRLGRAGLADRLIALAPNLDVYIIPDHVNMSAQMRGRHRHYHAAHTSWKPSLRDLAWTAVLLVLATIVATLFQSSGVAAENITSVYILAMLSIAVVTSGKFCAIFSSAVSVMVFNYLFVEPRYTFFFAPEYGPTFVVMFITGLVASMLTDQLSDQARQSALTAYRTKVLFDTNQMLGQALDAASVYQVTAEQLVKLLGRDVVMYPENLDTKRLGTPSLTTVTADAADKLALTEAEAAVAAWVFKNNKHAGATTNTLPESHCLYLAIRASGHVFGVVGIVIDQHPLDAFENSTVLSMLGECAMALESKRAAREREEAATLAKNEQLRANLLRSISHDLRTPLTAISGSAGVLLADGPSLSDEKRHELLVDINENSQWLIGLVENLLTVTRIEDGTMHLAFTPALLEDAVDEAVAHLSHAANGHNLVVHESDDVLMAKMDEKLIVQTVVNIIDNAIKYAPVGTTIDVRSWRADDAVICEVSDEGPGISDEEKKHIFEMFYTVKSVHPVDSRRSLGLGLALCRTIIDAHGGAIWVHDNKPHGATFGFALPAYDASRDEAAAANTELPGA